MSTDENSRNVVLKIGVVKSDKMDKTIVVSIERRLMHPLYKKFIKRYTTLVAHDEDNQAKQGDTVEVRFTRPLSKTKRWRLERVLEGAGGAA
ncbi:MAG: 30S ribosomal protein S17 [Planctomycetota bacterium]|nr:MAG: 30S ribosomal protein S17 [Planctomycetota bacterium]